jgi:hypothetical protein
MEINKRLIGEDDRREVWCVRELKRKLEPSGVYDTGKFLYK